MVDTRDVQSVQLLPFGMVTLTPVQVVNSSSGSVPPSIEQILSMRVEATVALNMTTGNGSGLETCGLIVINRRQEIVAAMDFRLVLSNTIAAEFVRVYMKALTCIASINTEQSTQIHMKQLVCKLHS